MIFNLLRQDPAFELLPAAEKAKVGIIARLPLASGLLTGKFKKDSQFAATDHRHYNRDGAAFHVGETFSGIEFNQGLALVDELQNLIPNGIPLIDIALRWILDHAAVSTVIAGVSKPDQITTNADTSNIAPLSSKLHAALATFYSNQVRSHIRGAI